MTAVELFDFGIMSAHATMPSRRNNIAALPLELLHYVLDSLGLHDFINLKFVCKDIFHILSSEPINKKVCKKYILYSREARLALKGNIGYAQAVQNTHLRREAFATVRPFSVLVLGFGSSYIYRNGVLCYEHEGSVRIVNIHKAPHIERVIAIKRHSDSGRRLKHPTPHIEFLDLQDDVLTFGSRYESDPADSYSCIAVDIRDATVFYDSTFTRLPLQHQNRFLKLDLTHMLVGRYVPRHGWAFHVVKHASPGPPIGITYLLDLPGRRLGYDVNLAIHRGYLYAVSNSPMNTVDVNGSSFYHCQRVLLDDSQRETVQSMRIWRRSHAEGPINDSWTKFDLRVDESTGELIIVETRREWLGNSTKQTRTFYIQPIVFRESECPLSDVTSQAVNTVQVDPKKLLALSNHSEDLVGKARNATNEILNLRNLRNVHSERLGNDFDPLNGNYLFQKSRYQVYDSNCHTFLDVVEDINEHLSQYSIRQFRLRIGSRVERSPMLPSGCLRKRFVHPPGESQVRDGEGQFLDLDTTLWPSAKAPKELQDLFKSNMENPMGIISTADNDVTVGSTVYCTGKSRPIVLVNFDPSVQFPGLSSLKDSPLKSGATQARQGRRKDPESTRGSLKATTIEDYRSGRRTVGVGDYCFSFWEERAMWMGIGKGFQLR